MPGDAGRTDVLQVVQQEYGEAVAGEPLLQLWSAEWDSWVDMREGDAVPPMSKVRVIAGVSTPQAELQDVAQVSARGHEEVPHFNIPYYCRIRMRVA